MLVLIANWLIDLEKHTGYNFVNRIKVVLWSVSATIEYEAQQVLKYTKSVQNSIREITNRIVKQFSPEQIILFGSHARGESSPDSDVDLLVVLPVRGSKRNKAVEIGIALHDIHISKDIIVTTPKEFAWRKEIIGTIEMPAAKDGKVLYAKS